MKTFEVLEQVLLCSQKYCKSIKQYHFSNHAISILNDCKGVVELHHSYEDNNIDSEPEAHHLANVIDLLIPDQWILIDTGDYIMAPLGSGVLPEFETYDPHYKLILVHKKVFEKHHEELQSRDTEWRNNAKDKIRTALKEK